MRCTHCKRLLIHFDAPFLTGEEKNIIAKHKEMKRKSRGVITMHEENEEENVEVIEID